MSIYTIVFLEFLIISSSILMLFKLRSKIGLAPLYIFLGSVQNLLAFSGTNISFKVFDQFTIYPASVILFCAVLFAVLLIYIKEGVSSARALIIGIIVTNFLLALLFEFTYVQETLLDIVERSNVFNINYKYFITGTIILLIDFILLIILYQFLISKISKRFVLLVLYVSLATVLIFDSLAFNLILHYNNPDFLANLLGHIFGKSISALIFSLLLYSYLKFIDKEKENSSFIAHKNTDIFSIIRYQKKYLNLKEEKNIVEKKLTSQLEAVLNNISDGFVALDTKWCYTFINEKAAEFLGKTPESLRGKHIWTEFPAGVGSPFYIACHRAYESKTTQHLQDWNEAYNKWYESRINPSAEGLTIYFTDITERKKAELALQESENHLRTILETEPECIKQLSANGELIYMNPAGLAMIEADSIEMVKGHSVIDIISPNHQSAFKKLTRNVFQGNSGQLEFEIIGIKGTKRWLETHAVPFRDTDGNIISLLGVTRDITDRKTAENDLKKSEKYLENIINNIGDPLFVKDEESKFLLANNAFYSLFNLSKADVLGKTLAENLPPKEMEGFLSIDKQVLSTGIQNVNDESLSIQGKETYIVSTKKTRYTDDSGNKYLIGVFRDITENKKAEKELKENEEKFSKAFESNVIGKAILNKDKKIVEVNEALLNMVGFTRENMLGKTAEEIGLFNLDNPKNLDNEEKLWSEFGKNGYVSNTELEYQMQDGRTLFILISLQALELNDDEHVMVTVLDITENKNAEVELDKYRNQLEYLVKIRTEEVDAKNAELQRMNKLFIGRELKMKELKDLIKKLQSSNGE